MNIVHQTMDDEASVTRIGHLLKVFADVREKLISEGGIKDLSTDFPLEEMDHQSNAMDNYLGMTYTYSYSSGDGGVLTKVQKVTVKVRYPDGKFIDIARVLPALLHEYAHCITEVHRDIPERLRAKKLKRLDEDYHSHSEEFYENFRRLLKAAELLEIYSLPAVPCKYNTPVLRRFDKYDWSDCDSAFCGTTKLYHHLNDETGSIVVESGEIALNAEALLKTPLTVVLCNPKGVRKTAQLNERTEAALVALCKQKHRLNPKKITTSSGEQVTNATLLAASSGAVFLVM